MRYERLLQEARAAGIHALPQLASLDQSPLGTTTLGGRRPTMETSITEAMSGADTPRARAELGLTMVCEAHAARGGHLYVMRDGRLELAASLGAELPDDELQPQLEDFCHQHLSAPDMPTTFAPNGQPPPASSTGLFTDAAGTTFQPIAIQCVVDGAALLAGVAALLPGQARSARSDAIHIVALVGSYLIRAGDAHGVPC
jgi:hypothetical protein